MSQFRPVTVFAPAKINLYLHIVRRREDGYHDLDSLAGFADIGDRLTIEPANDFSLQINGHYAGAFTAQDRDSGLQSTNLVTRVAQGMATAARQELRLRVILTKNLPLAAGLGGGSADAAAMAWGLMNIWNLPLSTPWLPDMLADLGADIPACLRCAPVQMSGIGDVLDLVPNLPEIPLVLVNPGKHCPTPEIFKRFLGPMRGEVTLPDDLSDPQTLIEFLHQQDNDLTPAAREVVPEIGTVMNALTALPGCQLARMSGSGATVFGLFDSPDDAAQAAEDITMKNPHWWVRTGTLNSPERY